MFIYHIFYLPKRFLFVIFCCLYGFFVFPTAYAEVSQSTFIGVVDVQYIIENASIVQRVQRMVEEQRQQYTQDITQQEAALRSVEVELQQQQDSMTPEKFEEKRREFERSVAEIQQKVKKIKEELTRVLVENMREIRQKILDIIRQVSDERGLTLVLFKRQVILVDPSLDITEIVLERLNQTFTSIPILLPPVLHNVYDK